MSHFKGTSPFKVIKSRYQTEKSLLLGELKDRDSNPSIRAFECPKAVFLVHIDANKKQIAEAIEEIYKDRNIKVTKVNTIVMKGKPVRMRRRPGTGRRPDFKKAIVTLEKGDTIENV